MYYITMDVREWTVNSEVHIKVIIVQSWYWQSSSNQNYYIQGSLLNVYTMNDYCLKKIVSKQGLI